MAGATTDSTLRISVFIKRALCRCVSVPGQGWGYSSRALPSPAKVPPSGPGWLHEIKHDGFRILARRDAAGVRLITRAGNDFSGRFPFIAMAIGKLPVRSCLIDGEAIVCDETGLAVFDLIRRHGALASAVLRRATAGTASSLAVAAAPRSPRAPCDTVQVPFGFFT
jgi:ATP dependent DNA ligase-like protein